MKILHNYNKNKKVKAFIINIISNINIIKNNKIIYKIIEKLIFNFIYKFMSVFQKEKEIIHLDFGKISYLTTKNLTLLLLHKLRELTKLFYQMI
jgi:hypothetical protein